VVFFNYTTMQMTAKIVYYGPGLCGKTTNLQYIHQKTAAKSRGEMISLETETDRTLFFDLLPLEVGVIGGMKVRLQLYTVPGQVFYNATRKLVLKGVDGIVFVTDSQVAMLDANTESLRNLEENLAELGLTLADLPLVYQYNKRDIRSILTVADLNAALNPRSAPYFEAAALHGIGVFETLKCISRLAIASVRKKLTSEDAQRKGPVLAPAAATPPSAVPGSPVLPPPAPVEAAARTRPRTPPAASLAAADPLAELVADTHPHEDASVEFAEEDTGKHRLRAVATKGHVDIQQELENLRSLTGLSGAKPSGTPGREVERRLQDMLVSERDSRQEVKRKATVEVPSRLLKGSTSLTLHLAFDSVGGEEVLRDAVTVKLVGNKRLERLTLRLDLDLKGK
jgi:hypothetical protein